MSTREIADRAVEKHLAYYHLLDALEADGCPICRLAEQTTRRYLDTLLTEAVNDPAVRRTIRAAHGFCRTHAEYLLTRGDLLGLAIWYEDLLSDAESRLQSDPGQFLTDRAWCPGCAMDTDAARRAFITLERHGLDGAFQAALARSSGLCLSHFAQAIRFLTNGTLRQYLLTLHRMKICTWQRNLQGVIRKFDYQSEDEPLTDDEQQALRHAITFLAGGRMIDQAHGPSWRQWLSSVRSHPSSSDLLTALARYAERLEVLERVLARITGSETHTETTEHVIDTEAKMVRLEAELATLHTRALHADRAQLAVESELAATTYRLRSLETDYEALQMQVAGLRAERESLLTFIDDLKAQKRNVDHQLTEADSALAALRFRFYEIDQDNKAMQMRLTGLTGDHQMGLHQLAAIKEENARLRGALDSRLRGNDSTE